MGAYIIGVDIGTQGTKAALFGEKMELVCTAFEQSRLISPEPGTVWQEPDDLYASTARTIKSLMEQSGAKGTDIACIGVDGQMAGIMGIGRDGSASTYYDSWLDMRCGRYMELMNKRAGKRVIQLSGGPATYIHGPKILWWKHEQPEAYARTAKFVLPGAYVVGRMAGLDAEHSYFDYTHLHFSCFADTASKSWSAELLETFDVDPGKMARIVSPFEIVGKVQKEFAVMAGIAEGIPLVAGCGDTAASTFGAGMFEPGRILDCAGTASVLCSVVDGYVPDTGYETLTMMRSPVDGLFLPLAYIGGGGMCIRWFRDQLSGETAMTYDQLQREAEKVPPGSEGVLFIPHFAGRVLPNNPNLKGAYLGLDFKHTRAHMYRAVLESIAYEYKYYLHVLRSLYSGCAFENMISIGGGASSSLFNQIKADVLGLRVQTFEMGETALLGSAVIAGVGAGLFGDYKRPIQAVMKKQAEFTCGPAGVYEEYAKAYLDAIGKLSEYYGARGKSGGEEA